jgi:Protein of unknown function (DUF433)
MENNLLQRITYNPDSCHGKPCIRGLYAVEFILELLSSGMTTEEILADYKDLEQTIFLPFCCLPLVSARSKAFTNWHHEVSR